MFRMNDKSNHSPFDLPPERLAQMAGSPRTIELSMHFGRAHQANGELRMLIGNLLDAGRQHDELSPEVVADQSSAARKLSADRRQEVARWFATWEADLDAELNARPIDDHALSGLTEAEIFADPFTVVARVLPIEEVVKDYPPRFAALGPLSLDDFRYFLALSAAMQRPTFEPFVATALHVRILGLIEPLLSRLLTLSLQQQRPTDFTSLASEELANEVRVTLRGGPTQWRDVLLTRLPTLANAIDWDQLQEAWWRRNLIVHNGGAVNAGYRDRVPSAPAVGTPIEVGREELLDLNDLVSAVRLALVLANWDDTEPGQSARAAKELWFFIFDEIRHGRWQFAVHLARMEEAFANDEEARTYGRVNRWIALDRGLGPESIRAEVLAWSIDHLPRKFQAARLVLLHDDERAIALTRELLRDGTLTKGDIASAPLFDRLHDRIMECGPSMTSRN